MINREDNGITQELNAIREQCLVCTKCRLSETRRNVVFGEGNPLSPLMIVGEGPGENEDKTGRPFVGRAGQLLDECLAECKMDRRHVFICNVVKCRACEFNNGRARNRPPMQDEIDTCTPWLMEQIRIIKPLVIMSLGAPSAKFIIKKDFKMTVERGGFFPTQYAPIAIAGLHPAYILRQMGAVYDGGRSLLVSDIDSARKKVIELKKQMDKEAEEKQKADAPKVVEQPSLF